MAGSGAHDRSQANLFHHSMHPLHSPTLRNSHQSAITAQKLQYTKAYISSTAKSVRNNMSRGLSCRLLNQSCHASILYTPVAMGNYPVTLLLGNHPTTRSGATMHHTHSINSSSSSSTHSCHAIHSFSLPAQGLFRSNSITAHSRSRLLQPCACALCG